MLLYFCKLGCYMHGELIKLFVSWYGRRGRSRSPRRSPTPGDKRPSISEGLKSRLGPRVDDQPLPNKGRLRSRSSSRSRSRGFSLSRSPNAVSPKHQGIAARASLSRSSSPSGQQGLVSYGDASPDILKWGSLERAFLSWKRRAAIFTMFKLCWRGVYAASLNWGPNELSYVSFSASI